MKKELLRNFCWVFIKKLFLTKTNRPLVALRFGQSGKGRSNPGQYCTKKLPPTICRKLLLGLQYELEDQTVKAGKIASRNVSSLVSWIAGKYSNRQEASQEIKLESNESRRPKFYEVKQLKENLTRKFCWKENFTEDSVEIKWKFKKKISQNQLKDKIPPVNSAERKPYRRLKIKKKLETF